MAEEISDEIFKSEVMRFIEIANQKFDGLTTDVRSNTFKLDHLESKLDHLESGLARVEVKVDRVEIDLKAVALDVKVVSGQFQDVALMAMKDHTRIDNLEKHMENPEPGIH